MRVFLAVLVILGMSLSGNAKAQMSSTRDAQHLAVLMAVMSYKINDEEHLRNIENLREDERFNRRVQTMLDKLSNRRSKNTTNRRVLQILENAGKDIYNLLD